MALTVTDALRIDSDLYLETKLKGPQRHKFAYGKTQLIHAEDSLNTIGSVDSREHKLQYPTRTPMRRPTVPARSKTANRIGKTNGTNP